MTIQIVVVPDLGGAETVEVIELGLAAGDAVAVEDSLLVLESDKATMDVPSPAAGVFKKYLVAEGATVRVGDAIAEIEVAQEADVAVASDEKVEQIAHACAAAPVAEEVTKEPISTTTVSEKPAATASQPAELMIQVPDIGSDDKVEVIEICVAVGDQVNEGDTLVILESDKATMDVPASHSGRVVKILVSEGDKLGTGDDVALFAISPQDSSATEVPAPAAAKAPTATPVQQAPVAVPEEIAAPQPVRGAITSPVEKTAPVGKTAAEVYAGPAVRMLARELGVTLADVPGSGPKGRILKDDVSHFVKQIMTGKAAGTAPQALSGGAGIPPIPAIDFSQFGAVENIKLSKIQKLTAANMQRNWLNVPHVTQFDDADITDLEEFRKALKAESEQRGIRVTPVAFLIKAIGAALQANPEFNRSLAADGEHFVQKHYVHVGMAVDTPRGLVVPVIRDVNEKGIWDISAEIAELAGKARDGKLTPAEMQGGCFTLSSLGAIGGNGFTPIVNAPEVGILGVSKSQMKPVWDGSAFIPRLMLPLALSYDHRAINGGDAGRFMTHLVKLLSDIRYLAL
ncbi:MAG: dihydrolipoyllysine-residue acetyltransferase [Porticoccaceae bacterium]|nr:dihydrolipoyllysine-residue acetyltransferase [Porticoccaceae bacterium]